MLRFYIAKSASKYNGIHKITVIQKLSIAVSTIRLVVEFPMEAGVATVRSDYRGRDASLATTVEEGNIREIAWEPIPGDALKEQKVIINPEYLDQPITISVDLSPNLLGSYRFSDAGRKKQASKTNLLLQQGPAIQVILPGSLDTCLDRQTTKTVIMEYLVKISKKARILELKRRYLKIIVLTPQYAVSIKEDTAYPCLYFTKDHEGNKIIRRAENLAVDHLSRLENPDLGAFTEEEIADEFPDEYLMLLKNELNDDEPWYVMCLTEGLDFMGPFLNSKGNKYILVAVDYITKWVEAQALPTNDARIVIKFLRRLFARFRVPKALINDQWTHFYNSQLEKALQKYGVTYKLSTAYHPQTNGQTEVTNRTIKRILESYSKNCFIELNELMELRDGAYENTRIYKERTKRWHDCRLRGDKDFKVGNKVLLFNSRFKMHLGKLKSRWYSPNVVKTVYPYVTVEIIDKNGISFKVNGQRLKKYHDGHIDAEDKEVVEFEEDTT
ncbi:reverse transcriptase domain-containing protein [Tanacetum coccineum]|uniref:Reverse transcriptase domain-containing protein n=1 Tax=Tanacetum coccineum TaxID=301880 RepID=A0ABQ4XXR0_9ASTR